MNENRALVIGLAGGVASGKSLVASCFEHFGATLIDADRIGHEVLKDPVVIAAIASRWGEVVVSQGQIDRSALARIVFEQKPDSSDELKALEEITHPKIGEAIEHRMMQLQGTVPAIVLDAPVMFKAGWEALCDKIVFVEASASVRQKRALQRGWTPDELARREARQTPVSEKRSKSTDIIDNSKTRDETYLQACQLWRSWGLNLPKQLDSPNSLFPENKHT